MTKRKIKKSKAVTRTIQTTYYDHKGNAVRINRSVHAHLAVAKAVDYMQLDYYQAKTVEVFDASDGTLHAVIRWRNKILEIVFKRDPKEFQ